MSGAAMERQPADGARSSDSGWRIVAGAGAVLAGLAAIRLLAFGWAPLGADAGRYLYVGLSVFAGDGPRMETGDLYLARAPAFGIALAAPGALLGVDPVVGGRLVAVGLVLAGCVAALRLGWHLGGAPGAVGVALALAATPFLWWLVPTTSIDPVQAGGLLATIFVLRRADRRGWALAGLVFGLTVLVKETIAPAALLPLAWWGSLPARRWLRLTLLFGLMALLVAGWWWLLAWRETGAVFPLNALAGPLRRDVPNPIALGPPQLILGVIFAASWVILAARRHDEPLVRALVLALFCALPAAALAFREGLNERQYAIPVFLSVVATGVALSGPIGSLGRRAQSLRGLSPGRAEGRPVVRDRALLAGATALAVVTVVAAQVVAPRPVRTQAADQLAAHLHAVVPLGSRVVASFGVRSLLGVRLFRQATVDVLPTQAVQPVDDPASYVWLGLRGRDVFGLSVGGFARSLEAPTSYLVIEGPGSLTPLELVPALETGLAGPRLRPEAAISDGRRMAYAFAIDPRRRLRAAGLHASADALTTWIRRASGPGPTDRLLAARPVVSGDSIALERLLVTLGDGACLGPAGLGYPDDARVLLRSGDPACLAATAARRCPRRGHPGGTGSRGLDRSALLLG
jgi:hypothetical protein